MASPGSAGWALVLVAIVAAWVRSYYYADGVSYLGNFMVYTHLYQSIIEVQIDTDGGLYNPSRGWRVFDDPKSDIQGWSANNSSGICGFSWSNQTFVEWGIHHRVIDATFPIWILCLPWVAIAPFCMYVRRKRAKVGTYCPECGYCLIGVPRQICPECGRAFTLDELGIPADALVPPVRSPAGAGNLRR